MMKQTQLMVERKDNGREMLRNEETWEERENAFERKHSSSRSCGAQGFAVRGPGPISEFPYDTPSPFLVF